MSQPVKCCNLSSAEVDDHARWVVDHPESDEHRIVVCHKCNDRILKRADEMSV